MAPLASVGASGPLLPRGDWPAGPGRDYYLDEFTFRFNRRHSRHRGLLFCRLLEGSVSPYRALTSESAA